MRSKESFRRGNSTKSNERNLAKIPQKAIITKKEVEIIKIKPLEDNQRNNFGNSKSKLLESEESDILKPLSGKELKVIFEKYKSKIGLIKEENKETSELWIQNSLEQNSIHVKDTKDSSNQRVNGDLFSEHEESNRLHTFEPIDFK